VFLNDWADAGNANRRESLSMDDLLIKVACLVRNKIMFALSKAANLN